MDERILLIRIYYKVLMRFNVIHTSSVSTVGIIHKKNMKKEWKQQQQQKMYKWITFDYILFDISHFCHFILLYIFLYRSTTQHSCILPFMTNNIVQMSLLKYSVTSFMTSLWILSETRCSWYFVTFGKQSSEIMFNLRTCHILQRKCTYYIWFFFGNCY